MEKEEEGVSRGPPAPLPRPPSHSPWGTSAKASFRTIDHLGQSRPLQGVLGWEEGKELFGY